MNKESNVNRWEFIRIEWNNLKKMIIYLQEGKKAITIIDVLAARIMWCMQKRRENNPFIFMSPPMSSKSPRFGWLIAICTKIDDYIAVHKNDYFVVVFTNQDLLKQKIDTKFPKSTILSRKSAQLIGPKIAIKSSIFSGFWPHE